MACGALQTPKAVDEVRGLWYCGSSNTDKSRKATEENPKAFRKAQNRWFDGYNGEQTIIMDDCDKRGIFLGQHLTSWTDTNPCTGKIKRGTIQLQHDKFICFQQLFNRRPMGTRPRDVRVNQSELQDRSL